MGTAESVLGQDPAVAAAAELREETGLVAARLVYAGCLLQGPGYCNQVGHVFLATELTQGPTEREVTEQGMICRAFTLAELDAMMRDGVLIDGISVAAIGLLRVKGLL